MTALQGYSLFSEKRKYLSHIVWHAATGYWPDWKNKREMIHHIDENPSNNELSNLRLMSHAKHKSLHTSGENHPAYDKFGDNHPAWKGENASPHAKYMREWLRRRRERNG